MTVVELSTILPIRVRGGLCLIRGWEFSTFSTTNSLFSFTMNFNTIRDTYFAQVHNVVMLIVTAVAVIVGVAQFVKRSWVENDMTTKVRNATVTVLSFVNNISGVTLKALSTDSPKGVLPVVIMTA